jgi:hypothetical protein
VDRSRDGKPDLDPLDQDGDGKVDYGLPDRNQDGKPKSASFTAMRAPVKCDDLGDRRQRGRKTGFRQHGL